MASSRFLWCLALVATLGWILAGGSQAQTFTLTDNGWTYSEYVGSQGLGDFKDPSGTDHMHQNWWWFRTSTMNAEQALSNPSFVTPNPTNTARLIFAQAGLVIELNYTLSGVSPTVAKVDIDFSVKSAGPTLDVDFFSYSDFHLNGTGWDDSGVLVNPQTVRYVDGTTAADLIASEAGLVGYEAGAFSTLRALLNDNAVYNVSNSGLPFGQGDMTNVFQWRGKVISGQQTLEGRLTKMVNLSYNPPPPAPVIPEPGTWALMLSGLAPVALRLRKKA